MSFVTVALLQQPGVSGVIAWLYSTGDLCDKTVEVTQEHWERIEKARKEGEWARQQLRSLYNDPPEDLEVL